MKRLLLAVPALFLLPAPAAATTGLICTTAGNRPVQVALVISNTAVRSIVSARLTDHRRDIPVMTAQSWLDPRELRVDLVDRNAMRHEARVRATWQAGSRSYDGSIWRGGQRRWIRCREG